MLLVLGPCSRRRASTAVTEEHDGSLEGFLHLVDQLALPFALALHVHVGAGPLDHGEALHAQDIVLQEARSAWKRAERSRTSLTSPA